MKNTVFIKKHGLTFKKDTSGYFIPHRYNVRMQEDGKFSGKKISYNSKDPLGKCLFGFIIFAKSSGVEIDNDTGEAKQGYLDIYQYIIAYVVIRHMLLLDSADVITAIARQAGKSHISRMLIAFSITFIPLYIKIKTNRWFSTLCSFKNDTAEDQLGKTHPHILDAIKIFNDIYPNKPLQYDCQIEEKGRKRKLKWNSNFIEINRMIDGISIPYSSLDTLGLEKNTKTPGYTSHFMFVDESQDVNADSFNFNAKPFTQRTGGICFCIGTANNDPESVLRDMYVDTGIPNDCRVLIDVDKVIDFQKLVSEEHAEKFVNRYTKELKKYGEHSDYVQTQYFINFNIVGDNFTSLERLKGNNLFIGDLDRAFTCAEHEYKIGAVDPALDKDMAGMVCGVSKFGQSGVINEVKDVIILHDKNTQKKSPETLIKKIVEVCIIHELDYIILDTTANQSDRAYYLYTALKKAGANTMIIPFDYSSKNKKLMFGYLEDSIFNQSLLLPKLEYRNTDYPYDELMRQLLYLKKKTSDTGNIRYIAPTGRNFYDDLPMSLAQFNYCLEYIRREQSNRTSINLGDGVRYYITWNKFLNKYKEEQSSNPASWWALPL